MSTNASANPNVCTLDGERIRTIRARLGMLQSQLACLAGISTATVRNAEMGRSVTLVTALAIATALDVSLERLKPGSIEEKGKAGYERKSLSPGFLNLVRTKLREIRQKRGMSQQDLADKSYLHISTIGNAENGKNVTFWVVKLIMKALDTDWDEMLGREERLVENGDSQKKVERRVRTAAAEAMKVMFEATCQLDGKRMRHAGFPEYIVAHIVLLAYLGRDVATLQGGLQNATAVVDLISAAANQVILQKVAEDEGQLNGDSPSAVVAHTLLFDLLSSRK